MAAWAAQHTAPPHHGDPPARGVPDERPGLIGSAAHWRRHSAPPPQAIVLAPPNIVLSQALVRAPFLT